MNWNRLFTLSFLIAALLLAPVTVLPAAELKLAAVLSDHMVLQRDKPVPVWGWADAGERVTVEFGGSEENGHRRRQRQVAGEARRPAGHH